MTTQLITVSVTEEKGIVKMNKNIIWSIALKNSICVICWTVLAILFNKWWIALFGALFLTSYTTGSVQRYYRVCDGCGKHSEYADSYNEALDKAKDAGWVHIQDGDKDYCPSCKMEF